MIIHMPTVDGVVLGPLFVRPLYVGLYLRDKRCSLFRWYYIGHLLPCLNVDFWPRTLEGVAQFIRSREIEPSRVNQRHELREVHIPPNSHTIIFRLCK